MINKNKLSEIQKKKPITLKSDMAKNMRYKVNQSKVSLSKGKYSEEKNEDTQSNAEKEACSPILNTPSQKGTEKSNNIKSQNNKTNEKIKSEDTVSDNNLKRNVQITNAVKKKEEIKANAQKLQSKLNEDIKKERDKKIDSIKSSEEYKTAQGQIEELARFSAKNETAKEQMKRQDFVKTFAEKKNDEKKDEGLEITAHTLYLRYLQNQKFNSEKHIRQLEKAGKIAKDVNEFAEDINAAEETGEASEVIASAYAFGAKKLNNKIANKLQEKLNENKALESITKGAKNIKYLSDEYNNAQNAEDKVFNTLTALPKQKLKNAAENKVRKEIEDAAKRRDIRRYNRNGKKIQREQHKLNSLREERLREQRVNFYKANKNKDTISKLLDTFKSGKITSAGVATLAKKGAIGKIIVTVGLPLLIILIILIIIASLFFWMDTDDQKAEKEILEEYLQTVSDFYEDKQIEILKTVDRFWGGFSPDVYTYGSDAGDYIESLDQYQNRWIKLDFDYEDVIALTAIKKFSELENKAYFKGGETIDYKNYDYKITEEDLEDVAEQLYTFSYEIRQGKCPDGDDTEKLTVKTKGAVYEYYYQNGQRKQRRKGYMISYEYTYINTGNHKILSGSVVNYSNYGLDFIFNKVIKPKSESDMNNLKQLFEAYRKYIDDVLGTSTHMPDYENNPSALYDLSVKAGIYTSSYVNEFTRDEHPAYKESYERLETSAKGYTKYKKPISYKKVI